MSDPTAADPSNNGADRSDGSNGAGPASDADINAELDADMAEALDADNDPDDDYVVQHPSLDEGAGI
jgi:hypothetical protein